MVSRSSWMLTAEPRISEATFRAVLTDAGSPAAAHAQIMYSSILEEGGDPAAFLAIFEHESRYGTAGITPEYDTKNPGNVRSSSTGTGKVVATRKGPFVRFRSWADGTRDMVHRLGNPAYPYHRKEPTIENVIPVWAPTTDGNSPDSYIDAVVRSIQDYMQKDGTDMPDRVERLGDIPVDWIPAHPNNWNSNAGPRRWVVIHDIEGTAASAVSVFQRADWNASTQLVVDHTNDRIVQMVGLDANAFGAGNGTVNRGAIQIEIPGFQGRPFDPKAVEYAAHATGALCRLYGIPTVKIGREDVLANVPGIIGHADVPNPDNPSQGGGSRGHFDPGPTFPWDAFMRVVREGGDVAIPDGRRFPETGYAVSGGFLRYWQSRGALPVFGYPLSYEFDRQDADGEIVRSQWFERALFEWRPGTDPDNWDVQLGRVGAMALILGTDLEDYPEAFARNGARE